jgi:hypothetical protein
MVEIGSYIGESTCLFAGSKLFNTIWAVDKWSNKEIYDIFISNTSSIYPNIIVPVRKTSSDAVIGWDNGLVDIIYIDACHEYDYVIDDINKWSKIVKPGGIISGHDYSEKAWPGVYKAVNEVFGNRSITVFCDSSWAIVLD